MLTNKGIFTNFKKTVKVKCMDINIIVLFSGQLKFQYSRKYNLCIIEEDFKYIEKNCPN